MNVWEEMFNNRRNHERKSGCPLPYPVKNDFVKGQILVADTTAQRSNVETDMDQETTSRGRSSEER